MTLYRIFISILMFICILHVANGLECYHCKVDTSNCEEETDLAVTNCDNLSYFALLPGIEVSTTVYSSYAFEKAPYPFVNFKKGCLSLEDEEIGVLKSCVRYDTNLEDNICNYISESMAIYDCNFCLSDNCNGSSAISAINIFIVIFISFVVSRTFV